MVTLIWFYNIPDHYKGHDKTKVNMEGASRGKSL